MIVRRGHPVALVTPIPLGWFESHVPWIQAEEEPVDPGLLEELTQIQKEMLELLSDGRPHGNPPEQLRVHDHVAAAIDLSRLEIKRLVRRDFVGYSLTRDGEEVVRALADEDEAENKDGTDGTDS